MTGTDPAPYFNSTLHILRGVAACAVLVFHWEQFFPAAGQSIQAFFPAQTLLDPTIYIGFGWLGVPLFFILSGLLLGAQVHHANIDRAFVRRFWRRRITRIYPAVWLQLMVLLALAGSIPGLVSADVYDRLWLQFSLWVNLPPTMTAPINGVWWTLPVELGFYCLLPLIGWMSQRIDWHWLLAAALAITLAWRGWIFSSFDGPNYQVVLPALDSLPGVFFSFMLGYSLNFLTGPILDTPRKTLILASAMLLALLQWQLVLDDVYWTGHWILVVWPALVAAAIAGIVQAVRFASMSQHGLTTSILMWLGDVSFGIYLWHFPVMRGMALLMPEAWSTPMMSVVALVVALPITLALASLSYYLLERPLMGWGKKVDA